MKPISLPATNEPAAKKIDYVGKRLAQLLKPHQFTRTSRVFRRPILSGKQVEAVNVFNLQGSKWNLGGEGKFCINVGVFFAQLEGTLPRFNTRVAFDKLFPHNCHLGARIHEVVPRSREPWWPEELKPGQDSWFEVGAKVDVLALGDSLCRVVESDLLPWFGERSSIEALALGLAPTDDVQRAVALALLGRRSEALAHASSTEGDDHELLKWLKA